MKKIGILIGVMCSILTFATEAMASEEFLGHWTGTGTYQTEGMLNAIAADFDLTIFQAGTRLLIKDCWTFSDPTAGRRTSCNQSTYTVNDSAQVFSGGQKIGDIFPGRISVYQSNSQVSELMNFDLNGNRELLLRYALTNMDGGISIRIAQLSPLK